MKGKNVVMTSHGRAPWYGPDGKNVEAYVIGIAGGSASGKVRHVPGPNISSMLYSLHFQWKTEGRADGAEG